jgi:hypothetical protein
VRPARLFVAAVVGAALLPLLAGSASAVGPFSAAHKVTPNGCYDSKTLVDGHGVRRGFIVCSKPTGAELEAVTAAAGAAKWALTPVALGGLYAAADDGTASYALYADGNGRGLYLLRRARSGAITKHRLSTSDDITSGALLVRSGKWLAMWAAPTIATGGTQCDYLFESKTLGARQAPHNTNICGNQPSLTFAAHGAPVLVADTSEVNTGGEIELLRASGKGWSTPIAVSPGRSLGVNPDVEITGTTTRVVWLAQPGGSAHAMIATRTGSGPWHRRTFAGLVGLDQAVLSTPRVAASDGSVFVAFTAITKAKHEIVEVEQYRGGHWTSRQVGDGTSGDAVFGELDASNGRADLVIEHLDQTVYTLTSHQ